MENLVRRIGPLGFEERRRGRPTDAYGALGFGESRRGRSVEAYGSLVRTIVGQQISTKAARSIYDRLAAMFGDRPPTPEELLSAEDDALRACGLSRPKILYLRDLANHVVSGELELDALQELSDEEVAAEILAVKGLGRWSADMFLVFHLLRPDVLPVGDLGVRRAAERAYDLPDLPGPEALTLLAEPWRPHRTLASLYLWESLAPDNAPVS